MRRNLIPIIIMGFVIPIGVAPVALLARKDARAEPATGIAQLTAGNGRVTGGKLLHPRQNRARREEVAEGQSPFATVVACADSRVAPELVFDQGLGDLFVVRVAGNVVDSAALGSIEYAAEHLHVPLIVVLGHERCGAVEAALRGGKAPGHIGALVEAIRPAIVASRREPGDALDNAVRAQIRSVVEQLERSTPVLSHLIGAGKLTVTGARYDLDTGAVEFLDAPAAPHTAH